MAATTTSRLAVRLAAEQDVLIRRAAEVDGTIVSDFTIAAAVSRARDVLADRRAFGIDEAAWSQFVDMLDRPITRKPRLQQLFAEESIFTDS